MRKLILQAIIITASLFIGAYLGPAKLNKAASYAASKSIHGVKVAWAYIVSEWENDNEE